MKWYIKRTENNYKEINNWFNKDINKKLRGKTGICFYPLNKKWCTVEQNHFKQQKYLIEDYQEITIEEFRKIINTIMKTIPSKVILLTTNELINNTIGKVIKPMQDKNIGDLSFFKSKFFLSTEYYQLNHLYFLSNEEIRDGDWVLDTLYPSKIGKVGKDYLLENMNPNKFKKIIASTDPKLELPQPTDEWIREYCNNPVDEVDIEYISFEDDDMITNDSYHGLKLSSDNKISILKRVFPIEAEDLEEDNEKIYSKNEMFILCQSAFEEGKNNGYIWSYGEAVATNTEAFDNWIDKNLK